MKNLYAFIGRIAYPLLLPAMRPVLRRTRRAYVVIVCGNEVLLVKNWLARDTWRLPGGGIKKGEEPLIAAMREVEEELGIHLDADELSKIHEGHIAADDLGLVYEIFVARVAKKPDLTVDPLEITAVQYFSQLPSDTHPDFADLILKCLRKK